MKKTLAPSFEFPGGGIALRSVTSCLNSLEAGCKSDLSAERLNAYCICQVYTISRFDTGYLSKWKVSHSFGKKAVLRFLSNTQNKKYFEDKWLKGIGLSRSSLRIEFRDRSEHPLMKFIFPEYEENTKRRMHSSEVGFYICQVSTLLWTPFSPSCQTCQNGVRCKEVCRKKYAELYRLRLEEFKADKK
ncbi:hypothetical protein IR022_06060 [Dysgonomonas sp. GY617]|nr:hypothetical protein [Dysgonomonas sp. GY617]